VESGVDQQHEADQPGEEQHIFAEQPSARAACNRLVVTRAPPRPEPTKRKPVRWRGGVGGVAHTLPVQVSLPTISANPGRLYSVCEAIDTLPPRNGCLRPVLTSLGQARIGPVVLSPSAFAVEIDRQSDLLACTDRQVARLPADENSAGMSVRYVVILPQVHAELLLHARGLKDEAVEASLWEALAVARQQRAKGWELQAATKLANLWRDRGRRDEARDLLAQVYGWFTEGFDTADLKEAKALLDELG